MFPEGRPDIFGDRAAESVPFIPREQIQYPDPEGLRMSSKPDSRHLHFGDEEASERGPF